MDILNTLAEQYQYPIIVSTHPRTRNRIEELSVVFHEQVRLLKPLGFPDYNKLQMNAKAVLSDSGTISEESSILNFPALNLREAHERPEAMEEASVMMVGMNKDRILQALNIVSITRTRCICVHFEQLQITPCQMFPKKYCALLCPTPIMSTELFGENDEEKCINYWRAIFSRRVFNQ